MRTNPCGWRRWWLVSRRHWSWISGCASFWKNIPAAHAISIMLCVFIPAFRTQHDWGFIRITSSRHQIGKIGVQLLLGNWKTVLCASRAHIMWSSSQRSCSYCQRDCATEDISHSESAYNNKSPTINTFQKLFPNSSSCETIVKCTCSPWVGACWRVIGLLL